MNDPTYEPISFSPELESRFEILEALSDDMRHPTYLLRERETGRRFLVKGSPQFEKNSIETQLNGIEHAGIPRYEGVYETVNMRWTLRLYIEGTSLDKAVSPPCPMNQAVAITLSLLEILDVLHRQDPPIIHRDIKPQNIIVGDDYGIVLIDFGISRRYSPERSSDTAYMGTRGFAPPEQYGFSQTDARADIYATGVLLLWLLTGNIDPRTDINQVKDKRLKRVIRKMTAFAPEKRYKGAIEAKKDLEETLRPASVKKALLASILAVALVISGAFAYENWRGVRFSSPLIERAVRMYLQKGDGEKITKNELEYVREICINTGEVCGSSGEYFSSGIKSILVNDDQLTTLDDLYMLPNLTGLYITGEQIHDITPIGSLKKLRSLSLCSLLLDSIDVIAQNQALNWIQLHENGLTDISVLAELPMLNNLLLSEPYVTDYSFLERIEPKDEEYSTIFICEADPDMVTSLLEGKYIGTLALRYCAPLTDFNGLKRIRGLHTLTFEGCDVRSFDGISECEALERIQIYDVDMTDLTPLRNAPNLKYLTVSESMRDMAGPLEDVMEVIYQ
ncbi:MAG: protein kinase [Clostridia bacterium]|nr:protein kinase [Clostridia bacterium]